MSLSGTILSAIGAAGQLFAGYGSVTLGPVRFSGLGKPKAMPIGGRQGIAVHKLPGGGRVLNAMGPDNANIAWSGYLDGSDASITARALDKLRQSGQAVTLAWDVFSYQVLVAEFCCSTQHIPMPYKISCAVIVDNSQVVDSAITSLVMQVTSDILAGSTGATFSPATQAIIGNAIGTASIAASATDATILRSAAYNAATNAIADASAAISSAVSSANSLLTPICTSLASLSLSAPIGLDTNGMVGQISDALSACGDLAQLAAASGYVSRAAANLQRASA